MNFHTVPFPFFSEKIFNQNQVLMNKDDFEALGNPKHAKINNKIFKIQPEDKIEKNCIALNKIQREFLSLSTNSDVKLEKISNQDILLANYLLVGKFFDI